MIGFGKIFIKSLKSFIFNKAPQSDMQPRPSCFGLSNYNYQGVHSPNSPTQQQFSTALSDRTVYK